MVRKVFLIVFFSLFSFLMLFPFLMMLITSLKTMGEIQSPIFNFLPHEWKFSNFIEAMQRGNWLRYLANSFIVTSADVIFSLVFNAMAGYAFARLFFPGRNVLFFAILIGIMVPPQVAMVPSFLILKSFPLVGGNDLLGQGGTGFLNTYGGLILPFVAGPIGIFLSRQFFLNFPRELDEAAIMDGASKFRIFAQIYLPLAKPVLATLAVLKATSAWNDYLWPLIITNTDNMLTVQLALTMFRSENTVEWNLLMAATTIVVLPLILLFLFLQRYFVAGIVTSGLKG